MPENCNSCQIYCKRKWKCYNVRKEKMIGTACNYMDGDDTSEVIVFVRKFYEEKEINGGIVV